MIHWEPEALVEYVGKQLKFTSLTQFTQRQQHFFTADFGNIKDVNNEKTSQTLPWIYLQSNNTTRTHQPNCTLQTLLETAIPIASQISGRFESTTRRDFLHIFRTGKWPLFYCKLTQRCLGCTHLPWLNCTVYHSVKLGTSLYRLTSRTLFAQSRKS